MGVVIKHLLSPIAMMNVLDTEKIEKLRVHLQYLIECHKIKTKETAKPGNHKNSKQIHVAYVKHKKKYCQSLKLVQIPQISKPKIVVNPSYLC